jgi:hypothetical protein
MNIWVSIAKTLVICSCVVNFYSLWILFSTSEIIESQNWLNFPILLKLFKYWLWVCLPNFAILLLMMRVSNKFRNLRFKSRTSISIAFILITCLYTTFVYESSFSGAWAINSILTMPILTLIVLPIIWLVFFILLELGVTSS